VNCFVPGWLWKTTNDQRYEILTHRINLPPISLVLSWSARVFFTAEVSIDEPGGRKKRSTRAKLENKATKYVCALEVMKIKDIAVVQSLRYVSAKVE